MEVQWGLKRLMETRGLGPLDLEREAIRLGHSIGKNVVYRLATTSGPKRIDRRTLASIISALRSLTGEDIEVGDIMKYVDSDERWP